MGKTERVTCEYLKADDVFADVLNIALYSGKNIVKPENLSKLDDTYMIEVPDAFVENYEGKRKKAQTQVTRYRDILRMVKMNGTGDYAEYCVRMIAGIEQQTNVHYAMPVRDMLYDALEYAGQVKKKAKKNLNSKSGLTGKYKFNHAEFMSGMKKDDKLIPVVTIVVYFQPEKWDGPKSLHEMLNFTGMSEEMINVIPDYKMLMLQPSDYEETFTGKLKSTLPIVLGLLKQSGSKREFKNYIDKHSNIFRELSYDAAAVINEYCSMGIEISEEQVNGKEVVDMCKAVEEIREEGRIEGESRGKIMAYLDMGVSVEEIAGKLHVTLGEVNNIIAEIDMSPAFFK